MVTEPVRCPTCGKTETYRHGTTKLGKKDRSVATLYQFTIKRGTFRKIKTTTGFALRPSWYGDEWQWDSRYCQGIKN